MLFTCHLPLHISFLCARAHPALAADEDATTGAALSTALADDQNPAIDASDSTTASSTGGSIKSRFKFNRSLLQMVTDRLVLNEADKHDVQIGNLSELVAKSLQHRRKHFFANEITGSARGGKLGNWLVLAYAAPSFSTIPLTLLISVYVIQFYELLGANLAQLAFYQALARGFDVLTDPAMSYVTDSCRWKNGRRLPFMRIGCIPYGLALFCLMTPLPSLTEGELAVWFGFFYILFFLLNTFTNIPYDALAPELTDNEQDRSKLFFVCTLFDIIGSIVALALPVALQGVFTNGRTLTSSSCEVPINGSISLHSCGLSFGGIGSTLTTDQNCKTWPMSVPPAELRYAKENCTEYTDWTALDVTEASYCDCLQDCTSVFILDNRRAAFLWVGAFFGIWYVATMLIATRKVKERQMLGNLPPPPPLVPSLLNTFQNKAFTTLLPAWVCDSVCNIMLLSTLVYYVRYVIEPEYSSESCAAFATDENIAALCKTESVVAYGGLLYLICAVVGGPVWLYLAKKLGKRNTWLLWSLTTAMTNFFLVFLGKGDTIGFIVVLGVNGLPFGAKFLADAILADVIDYDEFLTGARSEATYTMFKSFLPKIAAIPASAIPVALLGVFGHVPPVDGIVQKQYSTCIRPYIYIVTAVIPALLSFGAFLLKLKFPLKLQEQNEKIAEGISKLMLRIPAVCPISGVPYRLYTMTEKMLKEAYIVDTFMGVSVTEGLQADPTGYARKLKKKAVCQLLVAIFCCVASAALVSFTWGFLTTTQASGSSVCDGADGILNASSTNTDFERDRNSFCEVRNVSGEMDLSFVPVLGMVLLSVSITLVAAGSLRLRGANNLLNYPPRLKTIRQVNRQRKLKKQCADIDNTMRNGCTRGRNLVLPMERRLSTEYGDELLITASGEKQPMHQASLLTGNEVVPIESSQASQLRVVKEE
jgi:Na+/melibiose symporter-like transporter